MTKSSMKAEFHTLRVRGTWGRVDLLQLDEFRGPCDFKRTENTGRGVFWRKEPTTVSGKGHR